MGNTLMFGDCLELMKNIPDKSVDMILADLPYGKTKNKWDSKIHLVSLWAEYGRVSKENAAVLLFAQDSFSQLLGASNVREYRYTLIWDKVLSSGFLNANRMPLKRHEEILVFYKKLPRYFPIKSSGSKNHKKGNAVGRKSSSGTNNNYGEFVVVESDDSEKFPTSILRFEKVHPSKSVHPTQKPVPLLEYVIKTYTLEGETVLDNVMGSGSTGVACVNTNRNFIGIEKDPKYFEIAKNRIESLEFH